MSSPRRSEHLTMYGFVGVALLLVVGILVIASAQVLPIGWMVVLGILWLAGATVGAVRWRETVWIPLLSAIVIWALWTTAVVTNR